MKLRTVIIFALLGALVFGLTRQRRTLKRVEQASVAPIRTNLPPGFEIVCDTRSGLFAAKDKSDGYVFRHYATTNRQDATNTAWRWYVMPAIPYQPDTNNWQDCD